MHVTHVGMWMSEDNLPEVQKFIIKVYRIEKDVLIYKWFMNNELYSFNEKC